MFLRNFNLIFLVVLCKECLGNYQFDLFQVVGITANSKNVPGVTPVQEDGLTLKLTDQIGEALTTTNEQYSALANTFMNANDITISVDVKVEQLNVIKKLAIFTLQNNDGGKEYISLGLDFEEDSNSVEGEQTNKVYRQLLFLKRDIGTQVVYDYFDLGNMIKAGTTSSLMIRFQNEYSQARRRRRRATEVKKTIATVYVDCVVREKKELNLALNDPIRKFHIPGEGLFALGMVYNKNRVTNQFVGEMKAPKILIGTDAYDLLNACNKIKHGAVPSEPKQSEYDPTFFDKFTDITSKNIFPLKLDCEEKNGTVRFNGESWRDGNCKKYTCSASEIILSYTCNTCEADGKVYVPEERFTTKDDPCQWKLCLNTRKYILQEKIECPSTLNCDSFGSVKVDGECCKKCKSNSCTEPNTIFSMGCERKCSSNPTSPCTTKTEGCWCREGYARDANGICIPVSDCPCTVDSKVYMPAQIIRKSSCELCVCSSGTLTCMSSCS